MSELKGFAKTELLLPGESQTLSFLITQGALALLILRFPNGLRKTEYIIEIGASSLDIKQQTDFTLVDDLVVQNVNKAFLLTKYCGN